MVMTILEARVETDRWPALESAFKEAVQKLDAGIAQTFLAHSVSDPAVWRILTVWESREALDAMRRTGETPRGVLLFRAAGAEPALSIFTVADHATAGA